MLKKILAPILSLLFFSAQSQNILRYEQLAPQGLPQYPTDIHVFPDQSAIINVAGPYLYRFKLFNDSTLQNFNYTLVQTDSFVTGSRIEVLSNRIFTKGKYITRDGGNTWTLIKSADFQNFWFLKPDFWVFQDVLGKIFTSRDSANTWSTDHRYYESILGDEDYLSLILKSDSSIYHLYSDTIIKRVEWPLRYPGKALPLYYHQVDSLRYLFEVDLQLYRYELDLDTTFEVNEISTLNRPFINIYTPGNQFIREDNLSYVFLFADTTMQWINRSKIYNAGSFEYSDGRMWYNSYKPFHPFTLGNIAFLRPLSNQKVIWGNSNSNIIDYIANTSMDSVFYAPTNFINSNAELVGNPHNNSYWPFNQMEYGLGIAKQGNKFFETRDDGVTWKEHISSATGISSLFNVHEYNRAVDTTCLIDIYLQSAFPKDEAKVNLYDGSANALRQITSDVNQGEFLSEVQDIGFKNCDTGSVIIDHRLYRTNNAGNTFDSPFTDTKFFNFKRIESNFYLSSDSGVYKSNNYYDWQLIGGKAFNKRLDYIFNDSIYFNIRENPAVEYSLDAGNSVAKASIDLAYPYLYSAAGVGDSALLVSSVAGVLFKIYLPWATVPIALEEEAIQLPQISIFPNPNRTGFITIDASVDFNNYKVYNIKGQEIARGQMRKNQKKLQIIKPQADIYYLELNTDKGFQFRTKIIFE